MWVERGLQVLGMGRVSDAAGAVSLHLAPVGQGRPPPQPPLPMERGHCQEPALCQARCRTEAGAQPPKVFPLQAGTVLGGAGGSRPWAGGAGRPCPRFLWQMCGGPRPPAGAGPLSPRPTDRPSRSQTCFLRKHRAVRAALPRTTSGPACWRSSGSGRPPTPGAEGSPAGSACEGPNKSAACRRGHSRLRVSVPGVQGRPRPGLRGVGCGPGAPGTPERGQRVDLGHPATSSSGPLSLAGGRDPHPREDRDAAVKNSRKVTECPCVRLPPGRAARRGPVRAGGRAPPEGPGPGPRLARGRASGGPQRKRR